MSSDPDLRPQQRFLMAIEQAVREANREVLLPALGTITTEKFVPLMIAVAKARAAYLKEATTVAGNGALPDAGAVARLRELRLAYDELLAAALALEHAIERGYLDVGS